MTQPVPKPRLVIDPHFDSKHVAFAGRLNVWAEGDGPNDPLAACLPVELRVIQCVGGQSPYGDDGQVGFYLTSANGDFKIPQEWVGKQLNIELSPSAVDLLRDELDAVAQKWSKKIA